ncbi:MAG: hypothetical protein AAF432_07335 [Planctomycetota bacterium]
MATLSLAALLMSTGCDNAESKQDSVVEQTIHEATSALQEAISITAVPGDEGLNSAQSKLETIVQDLGGLNDARGGQARAKDLLLAQANRELANLELRAAARLEQEQAIARAALHGRLGTLVRLEGAASGLESISLDDSRDFLDNERSNAEETREMLRQHMASLDTPISELRDANADDSARVDELEMQATAKRREASELGPSQGFGRFLEALTLEREAGNLDVGIATRQAELTYELEPEYSFAAQAVENTRALLERINDSATGLEDYRAEARATASEIRDRMDDVRNDFNNTLASVNRSQSDVLSDHYEAASDYLDRAASAASQAARGGRDTGAAKLTAARIHELSGRLHWNHVRGLEQHLEIVNRSEQARTFVDGLADMQSEVSGMNGAIEDGRTRANESFQRARELLDEVSGAGNVDVLMQRVDDALLMLAGKPVPADSGSSSSSGAVSTTNMNADEFMQQIVDWMDDQMNNVEALVGAMQTDDPAIMDFNDVSIEGTRALRELKATLESEFGETGNMFAGIEMAAQMSVITNFTRGEIGDTSATFDVQTAAGETAVFELEYVDGRGWTYLPNDIVLGAAEEELEMLVDMASGMVQVANDLEGQVRAGDFDSIEEFDQAFQQRFGEIMQGMMGG